MKKVMIFESLIYSRYRLKDLFLQNGIDVVEASNSMEFFNKLYENRNNIQLIILEVNLNGEDGIDIMRKIKEKNLDIPVMVLTTDNTRSCFIKCIKNGATDYILKPYANDMILKRVKGCIENNGKWGGMEQEVIVDYKDYLQSAIDKAEAKDKPVSIILMGFLKERSNDEKVEINEEYLILNDLLYKALSRSIFKPNLVCKLGFATFIFILPEYEKSRVEKFENIIDNVYREMANTDTRFRGYYLKKAVATFKDDAETAKELIEVGERKLKEEIDKHRN